MKAMYNSKWIQWKHKGEKRSISTFTEVAHRASFCQLHHLLIFSKWCCMCWCLYLNCSHLSLVLLLHCFSNCQEQWYKSPVHMMKSCPVLIYDFYWERGRNGLYALLKDKCNLAAFCSCRGVLGRTLPWGSRGLPVIPPLAASHRSESACLQWQRSDVPSSGWSPPHWLVCEIGTRKEETFMDVIQVLKCTPANCPLHPTVPIIPQNKIIIIKMHPAEPEEID